MDGTHPEKGDRSPEEASEIVGRVLQAVGVPVLVTGHSDNVVKTLGVLQTKNNILFLGRKSTGENDTLTGQDVMPVILIEAVQLITSDNDTSVGFVVTNLLGGVLVIDRSVLSTVSLR